MDRTYNMGGEESEAYGIAVDDNMNVYVTGRSYTESHDNDVVVLKYDVNGNLLWGNSYDRIGFSDRTEGIVLDSKGYPYVVGRSYYRTIGNSDYLIMKYDTSGNILWSKTYDSGTNADWAFGIGIDRHDNLYVSGHDWETEVMTTIKFNTLGSLL